MNHATERFPRPSHPSKNTDGRCTYGRIIAKAGRVSSDRRLNEAYDDHLILEDSVVSELKLRRSSDSDGLGVAR